MEREKEQMMREKEELMLRLQDYAEKTRKAEKGGRGLRPGGLGRQGRRTHQPGGNPVPRIHIPVNKHIPEVEPCRRDVIKRLFGLGNNSVFY